MPDPCSHTQCTATATLEHREPPGMTAYWLAHLQLQCADCQTAFHFQDLVLADPLMYRTVAIGEAGAELQIVCHPA